ALRRRDLTSPGTPQASDVAVDNAPDALGAARPLAAGPLDRARKLVAVEGDSLAVLLHHREFAQLHALEGGEARAAGRAVAPPADRRVVVGRSRVLHLGVLVTAEWTAHLLPRFVSCASSVAVDGKAGAQSMDLGAHLGLDLGIAVGPVLGNAVQHIGDQMADLAELRHAEAARRAGRRAQPHARGDGVLLGIARDAVLVDGDAGAIEHS